MKRSETDRPRAPDPARSTFRRHVSFVVRLGKAVLAAIVIFVVSMALSALLDPVVMPAVGRENYAMFFGAWLLVTFYIIYLYGQRYLHA